MSLRLPGFWAAPMQFTREFWNTRRTLRLLWTFVVVAVLVSFTGACPEAANAFGVPKRRPAVLSCRGAAALHALRARAKAQLARCTPARAAAPRVLEIRAARGTFVAEGFAPCHVAAQALTWRCDPRRAVLIVLCSQGRVRFRAEPQKAAFVVSTVFTCLTGGRPSPPPQRAAPAARSPARRTALLQLRPWARDARSCASPGGGAQR